MLGGKKNKRKKEKKKTKQKKRGGGVGTKTNLFFTRESRETCLEGMCLEVERREIEL